MIVICILVFVLLAILIVAISFSSDMDDFEMKYSKYDVKVLDADELCSHELCWNCSYFYDGRVDSYPHVSMDDRPHPPCCVNRRRCLENKSKCYVRDTL